MLPFDDHIARGVHVHKRWMTRVSLHKPDDNRDVVSDVLVHHRNCAVRLEEVDGTAVVVCESGSFRVERRVGF